MVERRKNILWVATLLFVAAMIPAIVYVAPMMFSAVEEKVITTTVVVREPPHVLPPPANSSAIIRSHMILNGSVFVLLSIDKSVYSPGETVHIKGTATNLTPREVTLLLYHTILVHDDSKVVWAYPDDVLYDLAGYISGGPREPISVTIRSGETATIDGLTRDWNMTGIHIESVTAPGFTQSQIVYNDHPVPEGQYTVALESSIGIKEESVTRSQSVDENMTFEIRKPTATDTTVTTTCPTTTTSTITRTSTTTLAEVITMETTMTEKTKEVEPAIYAWAIGATAITVALIALLASRKKQ